MEDKKQTISPAARTQCRIIRLILFHNSFWRLFLLHNSLFYLLLHTTTSIRFIPLISKSFILIIFFIFYFLLADFWTDFIFGTISYIFTLFFSCFPWISFFQFLCEFIFSFFKFILYPLYTLCILYPLCTPCTSVFSLLLILSVFSVSCIIFKIGSCRSTTSYNTHFKVRNNPSFALFSFGNI